MTLAPASPAMPSGAPALVAIASGKGGTGTSTVAALLAASMSAHGRSVLLVDAADRLGTLDHLLGVRATASLESLRGGQVQPESLIAPVAERFSLLPAGATRGTTTLPVSERRVLFSRLAALFPRYDAVLFDAGASADSILTALTQGVTRVLAVTAGDRITVTATYALVKLIHDRHPDVRVDLVANRVPDAIATLAHDSVNAATVRFLSRTIHLAGVVPDDPHFSTALAAGLGSRVAIEGSSAAQMIQDLAERLLIPNQAPASSPAITRTLRRN